MRRAVPVAAQHRRERRAEPLRRERYLVRRRDEWSAQYGAPPPSPPPPPGCSSSARGEGEAASCDGEGACSARAWRAPSWYGGRLSSRRLAAARVRPGGAGFPRGGANTILSHDSTSARGSPPQCGQPTISAPEGTRTPCRIPDGRTASAPAGFAPASAPARSPPRRRGARPGRGCASCSAGSRRRAAGRSVELRAAARHVTVIGPEFVCAAGIGVATTGAGAGAGGAGAGAGRAAAVGWATRLWRRSGRRRRRRPPAAR